MSKNKKVALASVGVLLALILSVILIRSPAEKQNPTPDPPPVSTQFQQQQSPVNEPGKEYDETHQKVGQIIDDATAAIAERAPGWWDKIERFWNWFTGFSTYHAIILALVAFFIIGIIFNDKNKNHQRH
ncbi:hypothetical protein Theco_4007 (plasmid) [Thermobacillus composti KWC4]|uniref:Uncharacterized protein n=1 Tax=Thermobacillus composti (strain DSM 18247 / JCM 13945 / KWC4) TaxID=717605 RepID=L0EJQ2_THECK|nr:hypothetical protein [Thermobacillus composti]AGA60011.1 hypothetical protein Theco_4007 [Thermobacillus composti KWC4]